MIVTKLILKNWRNFRSANINLEDRAFIIGVNASGKSNLLDAFRFLRDVSKGAGGGLEKAVSDRGGITKLRSLSARREPDISIEVSIAEGQGEPEKWRYLLGFKSEGKGKQRIFVTQESVWRQGKKLFSRPTSEDESDSARLTQTHLQQVSANKDFRELVEFFQGITYLHLVPQLLKYPEQLSSSRIEDDPFGQGFLERVARTPARTRDARLRKIESALRICVPQLKELRFEKDPITGYPHLHALYEHWRPNAGWQREDQFSDGTLRLLGLMWVLLDGDGMLLLEEPELSLNDAIVANIPSLIARMQREAKYRRQVVLTTHSEVLLGQSGIGVGEVVRLVTDSEGTTVQPPTDRDKRMIASGLTAADVFLSKVRPQVKTQMDLWK
jgi:predicted ATPase